MSRLPRLLAPAVVLAAGAVLLADEPKYKPHDMNRPRPPVVDPGTADRPGTPPADAVVLFNGKDLAGWKAIPRGKVAADWDASPKWKVADGYFEIAPRVGGSRAIQTTRTFGDAQIHIEWATPAEVKGSGQGRGNSGLKLGGFGEVQILDSFGNDTYPDGQAAALYGLFPPRVNVSRRPGEWQSFDIVAELTKTDAAGKVVRPARLTVVHNGVLVHHAVEFPGVVGPYPLYLQDHGSPVRFRNVWVRAMKGYDEPAEASGKR